LYDHAQLARAYLHVWQMTGSEFFRTITVYTEEILYVVRKMADAAGGFYSTQDADSEGVEGKFFVWTPDEIRDVLGDEADTFMAVYSVTRHGNFEGRNILEFVGDLEQRPTLAEARRKLFETREKRIHPGRDEKVLTSWNGLMLAAFAEAARILNRDDYRQVSGNAMAVTTLLKLAGFTNELRYVDIAHKTLARTQPMMSQYPLGFGQWLQALGYALAKPREIAIVGDPDSANTQALLSVVRDGYRPFQVVALGGPTANSPAIPLLKDRGFVEGHAAAYVCRDFACQAPVTKPEGLRAQLQRG
jgi:uncharacterized protein YyaL (SSP411 family)